MKIAILFFSGAEELDFAGPLEVLGAARRLGADIDLTLCSVPFSKTLKGTHGLTITDLQAPEGYYDLIVIPGGGWVGGRDDYGLRLAVKEGSLGKFAIDQHAHGAIIAAVCTGSIALAAAGLLKGRTAGCHHSAFDDLAKFEGVTVSKARVVDTGDIISTGGVTSGIDLSLWLVERFFGADLAKKTEDYLEYPRQGEVLKL